MKRPENTCILQMYVSYHKDRSYTFYFQIYNLVSISVFESVYLSVFNVCTNVMIFVLNIAFYVCHTRANSRQFNCYFLFSRVIV